LSADLNSCMCVGESTYLHDVSKLVLAMCSFHLPASGIRLEILALSFKQACSYLLSKLIVPSRIVNILSISDRYFWIHKVLVILNEGIPFMVFWHGNRTSPKFFHGRVGSICFTFQYSRVSIIRLLDFPNNDRLKLSPRGFKIEVCLFKI